MHNDKAPLRLFMVQIWYTKGGDKSIESSTKEFTKLSNRLDLVANVVPAERMHLGVGVTMLGTTNLARRAKIEAAIAGVVERALSIYPQNVADNGLETRLRSAQANGLAPLVCRRHFLYPTSCWYGRTLSCRHPSPQVLKICL